MSFSTNFLSNQLAKELANKHGTPLYIYSKEVLTQQAESMKAVDAPYGLTIRYAMKANPNPGILKLFCDQGLNIDASSAYEVEVAINAGFMPQDILLTSQELPKDLRGLVESGVLFNATSLLQLEEYGKINPGGQVSVRINPGIGSGHSAKTDVGGITSSFGIWHEYIPRIHEIAENYDLRIVRLHTQIGSGADPIIWQEAAEISLGLVEHFPAVTVLNLGGGYKVARLEGENSVNMEQLSNHLNTILVDFYKKHGRKLHLELEPGTFLVANAGVLVARIHDIVDTGSHGYTFIKLDTGMNDILRPIMYDAQHPMAVINEEVTEEEYVVVGHNCESADLLTPDTGDRVVGTRKLSKASVGDLFVIGGAGAYCASMAAHGYNSFPSAKEILI